MRRKVKILTSAQVLCDAVSLSFYLISCHSPLLPTLSLTGLYLAAQTCTDLQPQGLCTCYPLCLECFMLPFSTLCSLPALTNFTQPQPIAHHSLPLGPGGELSLSCPISNLVLTPSQPLIPVAGVSVIVLLTHLCLHLPQLNCDVLQNKYRVSLIFCGIPST